ncbi:hypothetical protein [Pantoea sp. KPR_PJ]|uniref:hypothetical protein n=1 Tax=Pantoea sp. KPR_PJ TaxID=2738375 RepID=UPI003527AA5A
MKKTLQRVLITGNSGSGKSWLAARLSQCKQLPVTDLDTLCWEPGGYSQARERTRVLHDVREIARQDRWIIEGVYGWIADHIAHCASHIIWLTPEPEECVENIHARGMRNMGTAADFAALLEWAALYEKRTGSSSYQGHLAVFSKFTPESQIRLASRDEIQQFLRQV